MATYLLDSNIIIDVLNKKRGRENLLQEISNMGNFLACCAINVTEVYAGMRTKEEIQTRELIGSLEYYPITLPIAELAGLIKNSYARKGFTLATTDVIIAAVAIYNRLTLMTDNLKDFPMKELSLYPLPKI